MSVGPRFIGPAPIYRPVCSFADKSAPTAIHSTFATCSHLGDCLPTIHTRILQANKRRAAIYRASADLSALAEFLTTQVNLFKFINIIRISYIKPLKAPPQSQTESLPSFAASDTVSQHQY